MTSREPCNVCSNASIPENSDQYAMYQSLLGSNDFCFSIPLFPKGSVVDCFIISLDPHMLLI